MPTVSGWDAEDGRRRRAALLLLLTCGPALVFHPTMAIESLPVSAGATASAELLPTKGPITPPPSKGGRTLLSDIQPLVPLDLPPPWLAPWQQGDEVIPAVFELPDPLAGTGTGPSPFLKLLAGEEEDGPAAAAPADEEAGPDDEVEEAPPGDATPEEGVGIGPPEESDEEWVPAEPADPGQDPVDPGAGGGEPRDLLPVEREAGNCVITGEVSDVTTLEPIAGASVVVLGQGREDITDAQGRFEIGGLPPGDYTVEALKLEYSMGEAAASPRPGSPAEIRISLRKKPAVDTAEGEYLLSEESIIGEYSDGNPGDLFTDLDAVSTVSSGITKEDFSTSGVSDAADAVSKISGANIIGGKFAVVRGLADRYSNTLVNRGIVSTADPSRKAVQLDLFPSDLLESLNIRKTFTPDLPADFAGGTVLINTVSIPDRRIIDFSIGASYEPQIDGDFYVIPGQRLGFWGDGSPGVAPGVGQRNQSFRNPNGFPRGVSTAAREGQTPSPQQVEAAEQWQLLHSTGPFIARRGTPDDPFNFSGTYADSVGFGDGAKLSWLFSLTRDQGASAERDVEVQRLAALSGGGTVAEPFRRQNENRYKESVDWGFLSSASLQFGEDNTLSYTYFRNRAAENEVNQIRNIQNRQSDGDNIFNSSQFRVDYLGASGIAYRASDLVTYVDRNLEIRQLEGSHIIPDSLGRERIKLSWLRSESESEELRPDDRNLRFTTVDFADPRIPEIIASEPPSSNPPAPYMPELGVVETLDNLIGGNPPSPYRQGLSTMEELTNDRIDLEFPIYFDDEEDSKRKFTFSGGFNRSQRSRESRGDRYQYSANVNRTPADVDAQQLRVDLYNEFDDLRWILGARRPASGEEPYIALQIQDITDAGTLILNTDSGIDVDAWYLMGAFDWDRWSLYGGVRHEESSRSYSAEIQNASGVDLNNSTQARAVGTKVISDSKWYPSFGVSRTFGAAEDIRVLFAWSRTVARPTFLEFAPVITEDQATGEEIRGNPSLEDSQVENFDLSMSWRMSNRTFLQASLFHKNLTKPITKVLGQRASDGFFISYANAESGSVQGVEFDLDHRFTENWSLGGNVSYITSELVPGNSSFPAPILAETFEGQPNWIVNLNLGYALPDHGLTANLVYNFTDEYLAAVSGTSAVPSVVRDAATSLDFILRKSFETDWGDGTVTFKVSNLLDDATSFSYETGEVYSRYYPGREYSLSLSMGF